MNNAFYIGATGMQAQQLNVDTIANNLANVNTVGYKKGVVAFSDLMVREAEQTGASDAVQPSLMTGIGVGIARMGRMFDAGDMKKTGSPFDVAIQGDGFFEVMLPDGARAYTRGGTLKVNADGQLATQAGYPLKPGIAIPDGVQNFSITTDGRVQFTVPGQAGTVEAGQLELVHFANPSMLSVQGDNLFRANSASGDAMAEDSGSSVMQGTLESSNVKMIDEMVNLMLAQRAYEASMKIVQASDEISAMINNLRK